MTGIKIAAQILFLIVGALTVGEFLFVRGMFTWLIAFAAVCAVGAVNVILALRDREWRLALLYLLCTAALCMGYVVVGAF